MSIIQIFLGASVLVGIGQVIDASTIIRRKGQITKFDLLFSLFEYIWAAVCLAVLVFAELSQGVQLIALAFVIYVPTITVFAFAHMPLAPRKEGQPCVVPMPAVWAGGAFGCSYAVLSLWCLMSA